MNPETPLTTVELRNRLIELFRNSSSILDNFYAYSRQAAALAEEYHVGRFKEAYPAIEVENLTLACTLDARETPVTLDTKLADLRKVPIKKIVFDRTKPAYYLFV